MSSRERIIEGTWDCTSCDTKGILARYKNCPTCNNPREGGKESDFSFGGVTESGASLRETVSDEKALELADAGVDWLCHFCGTANRGDKPACRNCGAKRDGSEADAVKDAPAPPAAPSASSRKPGTSPKARSRIWRYVGLLAVAGVAFFFWSTRTREVRGEVLSKSWTRVVHRQVFAAMDRQGWIEELMPSAPVMPVQGKGERGGVQDVRGCVPRQRGSRQVPDGRERVCHTRTRRQQCGTEEKCEVKTLKNGFAKETCRDIPKYCEESYDDCQMETHYRSEPIYSSWCTYTTWDWRNAGSPSRTGNDDSPDWPDVTAGPLERLQREEQYTVQIDYLRKGQHQQHTLHPTTESAYVGWKVGAPVTLRVSNLGAVSDVQPAR